MIQRTMIAVLLAFSGSSLAFGQTITEPHPAVVKVTGKVIWDANTEPAGSGVWIDATHVLTALHVVSEMETVQVEWNGEKIPATIEAVLPVCDWALLQTNEPRRTPPIELRTEPLAEGDAVVGYGWGPVEVDSQFQAQPRRFARIVGKHRDGRIYGKAMPRLGDSGGPVFDADGRLVGVINSKIEPGGNRPGYWFGCGQSRLYGFIAEKRGFRWAK